jgi:hypothetical protein
MHQELQKIWQLKVQFCFFFSWFQTKSYSSPSKVCFLVSWRPIPLSMMICCTATTKTRVFFKLVIFWILNFDWPFKVIWSFVFRVFSFHAHTIQPAFAESMLCYIVILPLHTHSISFQFIPYHIYTQFLNALTPPCTWYQKIGVPYIWVPDWYVGLHGPAPTSNHPLQTQKCSCTSHQCWNACPIWQTQNQTVGWFATKYKLNDIWLHSAVISIAETFQSPKRNVHN